MLLTRVYLSETEAECSTLEPKKLHSKIRLFNLIFDKGSYVAGKKNLMPLVSGFLIITSAILDNSP